MLPKSALWEQAGCSEATYEWYQQLGWLAPCTKQGNCPHQNAERLQVIRTIPRSHNWKREVPFELLIQIKRLYKASAVQSALSLAVDQAEASLNFHIYDDLSPAQRKKRIQQRTAMAYQRGTFDERLFPRLTMQDLMYRLIGMQPPLEDEPDLRIAHMKALIKDSSEPDILTASRIAQRAAIHPLGRSAFDDILHQMPWDVEHFKRLLLAGHACSYPHTVYQLLIPSFTLVLLDNKLDSQKWQRGQRFFNAMLEDAGYRTILPAARSLRPDWQR